MSSKLIERGWTYFQFESKRRIKEIFDKIRNSKKSFDNIPYCNLRTMTFRYVWASRQQGGRRFSAGSAAFSAGGRRFSFSLPPSSFFFNKVDKEIKILLLAKFYFANSLQILQIEMILSIILFSSFYAIQAQLYVQPEQIHLSYGGKNVLNFHYFKLNLFNFCIYIVIFFEKMLSRTEFLPKLHQPRVQLVFPF